MTVAAEVQPTITATTKGIIGYDYDPYDDGSERAEGFFVGVLFGKILSTIGSKFGIPTLDDPSGFLSTYREWHIACAGAWAGLRAGTFADIPECPPLWQDEIQYYRGFAAGFNVLKCQWPTVSVFLAAGAAKYFGIFQTLGISI
jgi:hypothetical protein